MFGIVHWSWFSILLLDVLLCDFEYVAWILLCNWECGYSYVDNDWMDIEYWILTVRPESWRRLAFWCQSSRGVPVSIWIVLYLWWYVLYSYACILLLGVSSRVLFWPADKGKGKIDQQWAWRSRTLVHVGQLRGISKCCCVLFEFVFVVRRHVLCYTS